MQGSPGVLHLPPQTLCSGRVESSGPGSKVASASCSYVCGHLHRMHIPIKRRCITRTGWWLFGPAQCSLKSLIVALTDNALTDSTGRGLTVRLTRSFVRQISSGMASFRWCGTTRTSGRAHCSLDILCNMTARLSQMARPRLANSRMYRPTDTSSLYGKGSKAPSCSAAPSGKTTSSDKAYAIPRA